MNWKQPKVYAVQHKNEEVRAASRSGGIFTALSDDIFDQKGVVYGCVLTDDFKAIHFRADSKDGRDRMRGSKYIQSSMGDIYKSVRNDLLVDRKVLFSGTSCQVAGLKSFLGKEYSNLLCIDLVCHGVSSPAVWKKYLKWQEKKMHGKTIAVDFRNKKDFGWRDHKEKICMDNGQTVNSNVFTSIFYSHLALRPCCYECPYKAIMHPGDITIADYWGIEKAAPEFDDNKGVSLVLVNGEVGEKASDMVKGAIRWKQTRIEDSMQASFKAPYPRPTNRDEFWNDFSNKDFDFISRKYGGAGVMNKIKRGLKGIKGRLIR